MSLDWVLSASCVVPTIFPSFLVAMGDANEVSIGQKVVTTCCYYSNWKTINYTLFLLHKLSLTADFVLAHCYFFSGIISYVIP